MDRLPVLTITAYTSMQTGLKAMDGASSTACFLCQKSTTKRGQLSPNSFTSTATLCPTFNGDHFWMEELISPSSNQSFPSQPSSPSVPSCSPGGSRSSSEGTGSLYSWSSGVTCLLHSSIKKRSEEAFKIRQRDEKEWGTFAASHFRRPHGRVPHVRGHPQVEQEGDSNHNKLQVWPEKGALYEGRGSAATYTGAKSAKLQLLLDERVEAKLKFSHFLDEVTSNVLDPNCLQAFGRPVSPSSTTSTNQEQPEENIQLVTQCSPGRSRSVAHQVGALPKQKKFQEERTLPVLTQKTYLETDIDTVRRDDKTHDLDTKTDTRSQLETGETHVIPPPPQFCEGLKMTSLFPEFHSDFSRYPYRSVSLPRGINMVSGESCPSL